MNNHFLFYEVRKALVQSPLPYQPLEPVSSPLMLSSQSFKTVDYISTFDHGLPVIQEGRSGAQCLILQGTFTAFVYRECSK